MNFENRRDSDWICFQCGHHPKPIARAARGGPKNPDPHAAETVNRAFPVGIPAKAANTPGVHENPKTLTKPLDSPLGNI